MSHNCSQNRLAGFHVTKLMRFIKQNPLPKRKLRKNVPLRLRFSPKKLQFHLNRQLTLLRRFLLKEKRLRL